MFEIDKSSRFGARIGSLNKWCKKSLSQKYKTPCYLMYTRAGHIPHLTWNVVEKHLRLKQALILQLTLPSIYDLLSKIKRGENAMNKFCFPFKENYPTHLSFLDSLGKRDTGYNNNSSVSIWVKGGRKNITNVFLLDLIEKLPIDSFSTLFDYDTPKNCQNKRLTKSVVRSIDISGEVCTMEKPLPFASLGGGFSNYHRSQFQKLFTSNGASKAFSIDLSMFSLNTQIEYKEKFDEAEIKSLISDIITALPANSIKLCEGAFTPSEIFFLIKLGIDIFDSSFAILCAEEGKGFCLGDEFPQNSSDFSIIDFNDKSFANDFTSIFKNCDCYSCTKYTKGYIQHLRNTKEMLSQILLVIHNLTEFDHMFIKIREYLKKEI